MGSSPWSSVPPTPLAPWPKSLWLLECRCILHIRIGTLRRRLGAPVFLILGGRLVVVDALLDRLDAASFHEKVIRPDSPNVLVPNLVHTAAFASSLPYHLSYWNHG